MSGFTEGWYCWVLFSCSTVCGTFKEWFPLDFSTCFYTTYGQMGGIQIFKVSASLISSCSVCLVCAVFSHQVLENWQATRKRNHLNLKEKFTHFCKAKVTVSRTKRPPTEWEKIFNNPTSNRGLISNIYKELKKLDYRKSSNPIKNWIQG